MSVRKYLPLLLAWFFTWGAAGSAFAQEPPTAEQTPRNPFEEETDAGDLLFEICTHGVDGNHPVQKLCIEVPSALAEHTVEPYAEVTDHGFQAGDTVVFEPIAANRTALCIRLAAPTVVNRCFKIRVRRRVVADGDGTSRLQVPVFRESASATWSYHATAVGTVVRGGRGGPSVGIALREVTYPEHLFEAALPMPFGPGVTDFVFIADDPAPGAQHLTIELELEHPNLDNLVVTLLSPSGQPIPLHFPGFGTNDRLHVFYDDRGATYGPPLDNGQTFLLPGATPGSFALQGLLAAPLVGPWSLVIENFDPVAAGELKTIRVHTTSTPVPVPVARARAERNGPDVEVTWDPPSSAGVDEVRIRHGDSEAVVDPASPPVSLPVSEDVVIVDSLQAGLFVDSRILFAPILDGRVVLFRGESYGGAIDSASAIHDALVAVGEEPIEIQSLSLIGSTQPQAVFLANGTFPDNHVLTPAEGSLLRALVDDGVPVYCEGADVWAHDPPTPFHEVDGIGTDATVDGDDSLTWLESTGVTDPATGELLIPSAAAAYFQDQPGDDSNDRLAVDPTEQLGPLLVEVWRRVNAPATPGGPVLPPLEYATGVYHRTPDGVGNIVCQSWELGGFDGDLNVLVENVLRLLVGVTPEPATFVRGDANGDGAVNLGDVIRILNHAFGTGPSVVCLDAADSNDDGVIDLADAIALIDYLFAGGSPPSSPGLVCGVDPTDDPLDCAEFPCP